MCRLMRIVHWIYTYKSNRLKICSECKQLWKNFEISLLPPNFYRNHSSLNRSVVSMKMGDSIKATSLATAVGVSDRCIFITLIVPALPFTKFQSKGFRGDRESLSSPCIVRARALAQRGGRYSRRVISRLRACTRFAYSVHGLKYEESSAIRVNPAAFTSLGRKYTSTDPRLWQKLVVCGYLGSKIIIGIIYRRM